VAGAAGSIRRGLTRADRRYWLLVCLSLPLLLFYLIFSIKKKPEANWTVAGYFAGLIAAAAVFVEWLRGERARGGAAVRGLCIATLVLGMLVMALFRYSEQLLYPPLAWANRNWSWQADASFDPGSKLHGFRELAEKVEPLREQWADEAAGEGRAFFLFTDDRQLSGELSFYLPGHPFVYRGYNRDRHEPAGREEDDQYRFWPQPHEDPALLGADAMYVTMSERAPDFVHCFRKLDPVGEVGRRPESYELEIRRAGLPVRSFYIRRFRGYSGRVLQWEPLSQGQAAVQEVCP
jgi:hypothetical protein